MDYKRYKKLIEDISLEISEVNKKITFNDKWLIAIKLGISPQTVLNYTGTKKNYLPNIELAEKILEQAHLIIKEKEDKIKK